MNKQYRLKGLVWRWGIFCSLLLLGTAWPLSVHANGLPTIPAFDGANYNVLDPAGIPKYVQPLVIPPEMPKSTDPKADYNIAMRQFKQQILPGGVWNSVNGREDDYPATTVWSYGKAEDPYNLNYTAPMPLSDPAATTFNYPALTVEAKQNQLTRVRWINELYNPDTGDFLPHLLPVDRTLHWANPEQLLCRDGSSHTDCKPDPSNGSVLQDAYAGPVPIVTHVHGAHVNPESDGYPEAWWLPDADNIDPSFAKKGSLYDQWDRTNMWPGSALFGYYNTQRAATIWYHDHGLGITRLNVYAGPAGFWLIRGQDTPEPDLVSGTLPGPAPALGEDPNFDPAVRSKIREVPIAIQGRTFDEEGQLFFPNNRAYFEGLNVGTGDPEADENSLEISFIPDTAVSGGVSDVAPIWNPEFFGNAMVVNGTTWPVYHVAAGQYRLRYLNGTNARTLMLKMVTPASLRALIADYNADGSVDAVAPAALRFFQIGSDGGLLEAVKGLGQLLMMPAERADVILDFEGHAGETFFMINEGPDEPFGGGAPPFGEAQSNPNTTGQIMKFVVDQRPSPDSINGSPIRELAFSEIAPLVPDNYRQVSLNELESETVFVIVNGEEYVLDENGNVNECDPNDFDPPHEGDECLPFGPTEAKVGILVDDPDSDDDGEGFVGIPLSWTDMTGASTMVKVFTTSHPPTPVMVPVTEMPNINDTEEWEIWNFTADAHPIHLHLVQFQVEEREELIPDEAGTGLKLSGVVTPREAWETGWKDTVISYPEQATRIRARFDVAGVYVWHCHIIDHEDNEMMRPYAVVPDLNKDGCIDVKDLTILAKDLKMHNGTYDLNGDGHEDAQDLTRLTYFYTNPGGAPCSPGRP